MEEYTVGHIIVDSLVSAGVKVAFGIPGAKIDTVFNVLRDHPEIHLVVCRHEQNAAFMAAAVGRITGTPGVCIATSGPGAGNLTTGLVTATTECDPVVALIGSVPRLLSTKKTHQSMKALEILTPTVKTAQTIEMEDQAAEVVLAAFRTASTSPKGATVISIPADVANGKSRIQSFPFQAFTPPLYGPAPTKSLEQVARMIEKAKLPVLLLGMRASSPTTVQAVHTLLQKHPILTVETFQAAGSVSKSLSHLFYGRVGLFRNQSGDKLLSHADLVLTLGYDPTEYDANLWNPHGDLNIIHIDFHSCDYVACYRPQVELLGSISQNLSILNDEIKHVNNSSKLKECQELFTEFNAWKQRGEVGRTSGLVHPLHFVSLLQRYVSPSTTVTCDVGTVYIYMMRYFFSYEPRHLLCSDGQQTLGVGLPWAIAASLVQNPPCSKKVVSLSGDGGFMFSSQEMSTAVQQGCNITHFVWNDGGYNMVQFQEEMKFGRSSGIALGGVDFCKFAEAFDARGFYINDSSQLEPVMQEALHHQGVSIVDVKIDYSQVQELAQHLVEDSVG